MMIEFYTENKVQMIVTPEKIYRNGEVVAEGEIKIHHLMMNDPAWIVVNKGEDCPQTFIKTDKVSAVLPSQEFFNGSRCVRQDYKVSFSALIQDKWETLEKEVSAANEFHVRQILKAQYGKEVRSIRTFASTVSKSLTQILV